MQQVGLSMALGSFLAGVLLADSEYRHELEADIEPFKGLLLGLFFIAVGMSIDLGLFVRSPWLILALALGIVALKAALMYPIARYFGYCAPADALVFGGGTRGLARIPPYCFARVAAGSTSPTKA